ncbi:hypothetical protein EZJ58_1021 [Sodalis ligni]|uniref:Uncharacterized protein n=1 Tax=Sodalis ligni TaxID=2697027 RepID=A0A4R1NBH6_9GAMM|nr:hypothetical protein EZJ58_1021 [Sodalis ligni]
MQNQMPVENEVEDEVEVIVEDKERTCGAYNL